MTKTFNLNKRWFYLVIGVLAMLFSGVLYTWSILKKPFITEYYWDAEVLALNFTLTMCFFCIGAFLGSLICKRIGPKPTLIISGALIALGFTLTGMLSIATPYLLCLTYAVLAGTGIGVSYNVIVSTVCAWFPDKKGLSSGALMMGFGVSTLLIGNVIDALFESEIISWGKIYIILGAVIAAVIIVASLILKLPTADVTLPAAQVKKAIGKETFEPREYTTKEMLKSFTFWRAFLFLAFITAVGNSVISFAKDLAQSVNATSQLATMLVGVLAVCNGLGRILTGALFDAFGRRMVMISSNILTIVAAGVTLLAVYLTSLPLLIVGLCLCGFSYGSCPTMTSALPAAFYGQKAFSVNYSIMSSNLMLAALIANFSNKMLVATGGYVAPFIMLLVVAVAALGLNFTIRKP